MDIVQIAKAAVAMLAPYLAKATAEKAVEALYQAIHRKFAADKDDDAEKTLERLKEQPMTEGRQAALADVLGEKAKADPDFAQELTQLVQSAAQDKAVVLALIQVYGEAQVGKIINISQADVVHID